MGWFVPTTVEGEKAASGKHDWAVFLITVRALASLRMLEMYTMRWAIEVYFKEIKQHLGFMKEPGTHYASYIASMHLAATCGAAAPRSARASSGRYGHFTRLNVLYFPVFLGDPKMRCRDLHNAENSSNLTQNCPTSKCIGYSTR